MKFLEIFISIIGIIAIIAGAAFILIFLVDLFLSLSDKNHGIFFKKKTIKEEKPAANAVANIAEEAVADENSASRVPYYLEETDGLSEEPVQVAFDLEKAKQEQEELEKLNGTVQDEEGLEETDEEINLDEMFKDVEEDASNADEEADLDIDEEFSSVEESVKEDRIAKILEEYEDVLKMEEEKEEEVDALADFENEEAGLAEIKEEKADEIAASEDEMDELDMLIQDLKNKEEKQQFIDILEEVKEEKAETEEQLKEIDEELEKVASEKDEAQKIIEEKEAEIIRLKEELNKAREEKENNQQKPVVILGGATVEELEVRLSVLLERKKANAKELKKVRREYTPLNTIRKTLESDKKKLRRKDAIVAKQNSLLYGVNNYVDIDDEKAKRLTEENELVEGLRMSVRHCEDVLEKNKDRLPILEQAYNILMTNKETIDKDIEEVEQAIEALKAKK